MKDKDIPQLEVKDFPQFVKVSRNVTVVGDHTLEDGTQLTDTEITVSVNKLSVWPYTIYVSLLYLAGQNAKFANANDFMAFKTALESKRIDLIDFVDEWRSELNKHNDRYYVLKFLAANDKPVISAPPFSACPRCGKLIWPEAQRKYADTDNPDLGYELDEEWYHRALDTFQANSAPLYCLWCGQRFRYDGDDMAYKGTSTSDDVSKALKALSASQPTLEESAQMAPAF